MSRRGAPRDREAWIDKIDWVLVSRGAWTGFVILLFSGLINPLVANANALAGLILLVVGVVAASVVAAWRTRTADYPMPTGAVAALLGYLLVVPLTFLAERRLEIPVIVGFAAAALVIGAITGYLLERLG